MTFFDDGTNGKYLKVEVPNSVAITNSALSSMSFTDGKLQVIIPSAVSIKSVGTSFYSWTETDFSFYSSGYPLPTGSTSPVVDLSNSQKGFIFWGYGVTTTNMGMTPASQLVLQLSNDNSLWLDTIYEVLVPTGFIPFTLVCDFACKYVRLIVRNNTLNSIYLNMNYK
jgi:hypothetical protein